MTFWDSSALLPLIVEEQLSKACRALRRSHPSIAVWALTRVELTSAIRRLSREALLAARDVETALDRVGKLASRWTEVEALSIVRDRAERALGAHPLTAADALQLAAALVLVNERPRNHAFITADDRLARAATAEGFAVLVPGV